MVWVENSSLIDLGIPFLILVVLLLNALMSFSRALPIASALYPMILVLSFIKSELSSLRLELSYLYLRSKKVKVSHQLLLSGHCSKLLGSTLA